MESSSFFSRSRPPVINEASTVGDILREIEHEKGRYSALTSYFADTKGHKYVRVKHEEKHYQRVRYLESLILKKQNKVTVEGVSPLTSPKDDLGFSTCSASGGRSVRYGSIFSGYTNKHPSVASSNVGASDPLRLEGSEAAWLALWRRLATSTRKSDHLLLRILCERFSDRHVLRSLLSDVDELTDVIVRLVVTSCPRDHLPDLTAMCERFLTRERCPVTTHAILSSHQVYPNAMVGDRTMLALCIELGWHACALVLLELGATTDGALHAALELLSTNASKVSIGMLPYHDTSGILHTSSIALSHPTDTCVFGLSSTHRLLRGDVACGKNNETWYYECVVPTMCIEAIDVVRVGWCTGALAPGSEAELGGDVHSWAVSIASTSNLSYVLQRCPDISKKGTSPPTSRPITREANSASSSSLALQAYLVKHHNGHYQHVHPSTRPLSIPSGRVCVISVMYNAAEGTMSVGLDGAKPTVVFDTLPTTADQPHLDMYPAVSVRYGDGLIEAAAGPVIVFDEAHLKSRPHGTTVFGAQRAVEDIVQTVLEAPGLDVNARTSAPINVNFNVSDVDTPPSSASPTMLGSSLTKDFCVGEVSPLLHALYTYQIGIACMILSHDDIYVDFTDSEGNTALIISCLRGYTDIAAQLISKGADVNTVNRRKYTALLISVLQQSIPCSDLLISHPNIDLSATNAHRSSALLLAVKVGCQPIVERLLAAGTKIKICDRNNVTPLIAACMSTFDTLSMLLLSSTAYSPADLNFRDRTTHATALIYAARHGHTTVCKELVRLGADVTCTTDDGLNALHEACLESHEDTALALLQSDDMKLNDADAKGNTALSMACERGMITLVTELVRRNADVNTMNKNGYSPLLVALMNYQEECATALITLCRRKLFAEHKDRNGDNALNWAVRSGLENAVELLLDVYDMDPNSPNKAGLGALAVGIAHDKEAACVRLIQCSKKKVDLDAFCNGGSMLTSAFRQGLKVLCGLMFGMGATCHDPDIANAIKTGEFPSMNNPQHESLSAENSLSRGGSMRRRLLPAQSMKRSVLVRDKSLIMNNSISPRQNTNNSNNSNLVRTSPPTLYKVGSAPVDPLMGTLSGSEGILDATLTSPMQGRIKVIAGIQQCVGPFPKDPLLSVVLDRLLSRMCPSAASDLITDATGELHSTSAKARLLSIINKPALPQWNPKFNVQSLSHPAVATVPLKESVGALKDVDLASTATINPAAADPLVALAEQFALAEDPIVLSEDFNRIALHIGDTLWDPEVVFSRCWGPFLSPDGWSGLAMPRTHLSFVISTCVSDSSPLYAAWLAVADEDEKMCLRQLRVIHDRGDLAPDDWNTPIATPITAFAESQDDPAMEITLLHACISRDLPECVSFLLSEVGVAATFFHLCPDKSESISCAVLAVLNGSEKSFAVIMRHMEAMRKPRRLSASRASRIPADTLPTTLGGNTLLHILVLNDFIAEVKAMCSSDETTTVNVANNYGVTPLELMCARGKAFGSVIERLLDEKRVAADLHDHGAVLMACAVGQMPELAIRLIQYGFRAVSFDRKRHNIFTNFVMFLSEVSSWPRSIYQLVQNIDVNAKGVDGKASLHHACERGNTTVIDMLMGMGCSATATSTHDGLAPLEYLWSVSKINGHMSDLARLMRATDAKARRKWICQVARYLPDLDLCTWCLNSATAMPSLLSGDAASEPWTAAAEFWLAVQKVMFVFPSELGVSILRRLTDVKPQLISSCSPYAIALFLSFSGNVPFVSIGERRQVELEAAAMSSALNDSAAMMMQSMSPTAPLTLTPTMMESMVKSETSMNRAPAPPGPRRGRRNPRQGGASAISHVQVLDRVLEHAAVETATLAEVVMHLVRFGEHGPIRQVASRLPHQLSEVRKSRMLLQVAVVYNRREAFFALLGPEKPSGGVGEHPNKLVTDGPALSECVFLGKESSRSAMEGTLQALADIRVTASPHMIRFLCGEGLGYRNALGDTVLHLAVMSGDVEQVRAVADRYPRLVAVRNDAGLRPLDYTSSPIIINIIRPIERREGMTLFQPECLVEIKTVNDESASAAVVSALEAALLVWEPYDGDGPPVAYGRRVLAVSMPFHALTRTAASMKLSLRPDGAKQTTASTVARCTVKAATPIQLPVPFGDLEATVCTSMTKQQVVTRVCRQALLKHAGNASVTPVVWYSTATTE